MKKYRVLIIFLLFIFFSCSSNKATKGRYIKEIKGYYLNKKIEFNNKKILEDDNNFLYSNFDTLKLTFYFSKVKKCKDVRVLNVFMYTEDNLIFKKEKIIFSPNTKDDFSFDFYLLSNGKIPPGEYKISLVDKQNVIDSYLFKIENDLNFKYISSSGIFIKKINNFFIDNNGVKQNFAKKNIIQRSNVKDVSCEIELLSKINNYDKKIDLGIFSLHKKLNIKKETDRTIDIKAYETISKINLKLKTDFRWNPGEYELLLKSFDNIFYKTDFIIEDKGTIYDSGIERFITPLLIFTSNKKVLAEDEILENNKFCSFDDKFLFLSFNLYNEEPFDRVVSNLLIKFINPLGKLIDSKSILLNLSENEKNNVINDYFLLNRTNYETGKYKIEMYRDDVFIKENFFDISTSDEKVFIPNYFMFIESVKLKESFNERLANSYNKNELYLNLILQDRKKYREFELSVNIINKDNKIFAYGKKHFIIEEYGTKINLDIPIKVNPEYMKKGEGQVKLFLDGKFVMSKFIKIENL